jgi:chemotaxis-related protein WspD
MNDLQVVKAPPEECWNKIGVRGDSSCPELKRVVHCHNCPVFACAGRRFLNAPSPPGYQDEWTERLATLAEEEPTDLRSMLVFRIAEEWLALAVSVLIEVTTPRPVHRIPYRGGLLAGLVNIRGELLLCVHLNRLLGIAEDGAASDRPGGPEQQRLLVVSRGERWVFPVDEVLRVVRFPSRLLNEPPVTVARARARLTGGVFTWRERTIGCLEETRLFTALREKMR